MLSFFVRKIYFWGSDREVSKNTMSEFYRNISIQALSTLNNETELEFYHATQLIKNINFDFQINVYENKSTTQKLGNKNYWQLKL